MNAVLPEPGVSIMQLLIGFFSILWIVFISHWELSLILGYVLGFYTEKNIENWLLKNQNWLGPLLVNLKILKQEAKK